MHLHFCDQSKKHKLVRFYNVIILSEKKDPKIKKPVNSNIYIAS